MQNIGIDWLDELGALLQLPGHVGLVVEHACLNELLDKIQQERNIFIELAIGVVLLEKLSELCNLQNCCIDHKGPVILGPVLLRLLLGRKVCDAGQVLGDIPPSGIKNDSEIGECVQGHVPLLVGGLLELLLVEVEEGGVPPHLGVAGQKAETLEQLHPTAAPEAVQDFEFGLLEEHLVDPVGLDVRQGRHQEYGFVLLQRDQQVFHRRVQQGVAEVLGQQPEGFERHD